jgi:thiopeptide-type bacteriocin biosynthesis protein
MRDVNGDRPTSSGRRSSQWLSIHLSVGAPVSSPACDEFLANVVGQSVAGPTAIQGFDAFFFVRYVDRDHHIRLRLRLDGSATSTDISEAFRMRMHQLVGSLERAANIDAVLEDNPPRCELVPYVPELQRYGGEHGVAIAEDLFIASSRFALEAIRTSRANFDRRRIGTAVIATVTAAMALLDSPHLVSEFLDAYWRGYVKYAGRRDGATMASLTNAFHAAYDSEHVRWSDLVANLFSSDLDLGDWPALSKYRSAVTACRVALDEAFERGLIELNRSHDNTAPLCRATLLNSYVHMTNNRLGVAGLQEAYAGFAAHRATNNYVEATFGDAGVQR